MKTVANFAKSIIILYNVYLPMWIRQRINSHNIFTVLTTHAIYAEWTAIQLQTIEIRFQRLNITCKTVKGNLVIKYIYIYTYIYIYIERERERERCSVENKYLNHELFLKCTKK